tara:strand:+ start:392 stop:1192 length:801 start_codon:yes stop_codon:yes gene_type:complete
MEFYKKIVYDFWEKESCGTNFTTEKKYSKKYFEDIEKIRYSLEPMIKPFAQFGKYKNLSVLEVGVGAGTDFINWIRSGSKVTGIDLTDEAINNVNRRLLIESLEPESLQRADAENLPFKDNSFDLTYSWGVIHHSPDTEKCLSEIIRVTKPGGEIKIMVYNRRSVAALWVWVRFCLLKGKFWKSIEYALSNFVESPGTKAYTKSEIHSMFSKNNNVKLNKLYTVTTWCDRATSSKSLVVKFIHKILIFIGGGDKAGWFMMINASKI